MRTIIYITISFGVLTANGGIANTLQETDEFALDGFLLQYVNKLKELMKEGDPQYGIPVLDPFQFQLKVFNFDRYVFSMQSNITMGNFAGLSDFQIKRLNLSSKGLSLDIKIYFPSLNFTSDYYEMKGSIAEAIPLAGIGVLHFEVYNLELQGKFILSESADGKSSVIDGLEDAQFSVSRIVSKTTIDNNIDEIANAMIEELLPGYLNRFNKLIAGVLSDPIVQTINAFLFNST